MCDTTESSSTTAASARVSAPRPCQVPRARFLRQVTTRVQELVAVKRALKGRFCHAELLQETRYALLVMLQNAATIRPKACPC